jgi:hypothetical protein
MWFRTLFDAMKSGGSRPPIQRARHGALCCRPVPCRLSIEALEDRLVPASLSVGDASLVEGNAGIQYAAVVVSLDAPSTRTVTLNYGTANGTAHTGSDYQAASGKLSFAPGQTRKTIFVPVNGDRRGEPNESFFVKLSGAKNATIADAQGVVTIVDDEPRLGISGAAAMEGNTGATIFTFTVRLSAAYDQAVNVFYATRDGSATTADNDYVPTSGTLTFAPGETTKTITVEIIGDTKIEPGEALFVNLSGASTNVLVEIALGTAYLVDDDIWALPPPPEDDCNWGPYGCQ